MEPEACLTENSLLPINSYRMPTGKVYLIGAGPGDPGLLTLKGKRCLEEADIVIHDYLVDARILAYARPEAELFYAGKKSGGDSMPQPEINRLILDHALHGRTVARLKGGDPFLFGREERKRKS